MEWFNPFEGATGGGSGGEGRPGKDGRGITSIIFKSSTGGATAGIPGATDTYEVKYTDNTTSTFIVKNGENGQTGSTPLLRESLNDIEVSYDNGTSWQTLLPLDDITGPAGTTEADAINYDNTTSLLESSNLQDAIDELAEKNSVKISARINPNDEEELILYV